MEYREVCDVVLKNKIKKLRADIKDWSHKKHVDQSRNKKEICDRIKDWDEKEENGLLTEFDITNRDEDRMELIQIDQMERNMLVQKSRINWAIEGDENSRFFHNYINKNYRRNNIMGLMWNGIWSIDPSIIKQAAFRHFSTRFKEPIPNRVVFSSLLFRQLEFDDVCLLKAEFSLPEVKAAIWNCSRSKAPGPDGLNFNFIKRPFSLIGCIYKVISKILASRLACVIHKVIWPNQTAFLLGRQILDGALIAYEIFNYVKKVNKKLLLLKVDFEKAFDSVNWNFILNIMEQIGFGSKWCKWIRGCLSSATISVLVNRSPTNEFCMERGLRQGEFSLLNCRGGTSSYHIGVM
ncbi:RNA-directed DNA polymerase, eukaryota [Tanacetum coccineum]